MNERLAGRVAEYARKIHEENLFGKKTNNISVRVDDEVFYITKSGVDFKDFDVRDVLELRFSDEGKWPEHTAGEAAMHAGVYRARPDVGAIMVTSPTCTMALADKNVTLPPVLEDMAQIVGPSAKTAKTNDTAGIVKALKGRGSCMLKGVGSLSTGSTLYEAYTACMVLDKAAHTLVMASSVGGCVPLNGFVAKVEHLVYREKYRKTNEKAMLADERGQEADNVAK